MGTQKTDGLAPAFRLEPNANLVGAVHLARKAAPLESATCCGESSPQHHLTTPLPHVNNGDTMSVKEAAVNNKVPPRLWDLEEDEILMRARKKGMTLQEVQYELAHAGYTRTVNAVKARAHVIMPEPLPPEIVPLTVRVWTPEEDAIVKTAAVSGKTDAQIVKILADSGYARTYRAVGERRWNFLGLKNLKNAPKLKNESPPGRSPPLPMSPENERYYRLAMGVIDAVFS